ncbi:MAG: dihydroneopterin aldolase [Hydrocarboniphaga sp.]|uniref:thioredoxin family protein n=1 Tax=Hydrocarboniphaga sp. TaxID=2033016 RepID=UPI002613DE82|nr:thioredoxin family protein [Hydrocarboniphaga sp.]MDB5970990.1 dihydroneopterin aldolase [Hydrocarboniphaga sp.]
MKPTIKICFAGIGVLLSLAACHRKEPEASPAKEVAFVPAALIPSEIDWREGNVDEAFAEAKEKNKPVLLYWGARWCPPCNQLKATVFKRPAFIQQTLQFVAVHLDGDSPGAQRWGEYFGIVGYPTLIVLRSDRTELTRISGGTDVEQFPKVLAMAQRQTATAAELRDRALKSPDQLSANDWMLLANYGWDVDLDRLSGAGQGAQLLQKLADACPVDALRPRFAILALATAAREADKPATALPAGQQAAAQTLLLSVMQDRAQLRANHAELSYDGATMIAAASAAGSEPRRQLSEALTQAMDRVYANDNLPVLDRLDAVTAEIDLAHLQSGEKAPLPPALIDKVRRRAAWADAQSKTPFERQAVISTAADLLQTVGDNAQAEQMLLAELPKSQAPYYYMPHLSDLAKERGDNKQAADWLRKAYDASDGPATRAQWGVAYVRGLIELEPQDARTIETATTQVIDEIAANPDSYYQRTRMRFDKLAVSLKGWSASNRQAPVLQRLRTHMDGVCGKLPADSEALGSCKSWLA